MSDSSSGGESRRGFPAELEGWFARRTLLGSPDPEEAAALKRERGLSVSVCLPALDEEATIGAICTTIATELVGGCGLVDELIVVDSGSSDATAAEARGAGATVVRAAEVLHDEVGNVPGGKGEVLWKSLAVATGDIVVWLDSDTKGFGSHFVTNLVAPLLEDDAILLCKGFYRRPLATEAGHLGEGGGRVTELAARPLLGLLFPELAGVVQPLSGEYAGRAAVLRSLPMFTGYAVEAGILIDLVARYGLEALAQADLGTRVHRNRDVRSLGRMSAEIMSAILARAEDHGRIKMGEGLDPLLVQYEEGAGHPRPLVARVELAQRPPMDEVLR
ncbi:MAG: glucosyl-3-phosphoglycerate synthase [Actinomycetota bacterium]|nr:glucosyl-3-phosphoglycerate synthase [Actinomycetota bacterium]